MKGLHPLLLILFFSCTLTHVQPTDTYNEKIKNYVYYGAEEVLNAPSLTKKMKPRPHIILILADDMGWNDVSFHGSGQYLTPNIDALAYNGIILDRLYATPICTPSRSALMSGYYPIHTGMQHRVIYGLEPRGLPLNIKTLPQHLNDLGYESHMVGKWHLGHWKKKYTPLFRGFKSHLGPWTGHHHYYDHFAREWEVEGSDMKENMTNVDLKGNYTTHIISNRSVELVEKHDSTKPLFLYVSHVACHSADVNDPLPAPKEVVAKFSNINSIKRRQYAAIAWIMDESVGHLIEALRKKNMLKNSIIIFSSDNGGAAAGFNNNAASNWPLKGVKNTLWEGGVRVSAAIWSPLLKKQNRVSQQYMHFVDWLPTLYSAAGGNVKKLGKIDGINMWKSLSENAVSPRIEILHNIDDVFGISAITSHEWKLISGRMYTGEWDRWFGEDGRKYPYNYNTIIQSPTYKALKSIGHGVDKKKMEHLRKLTEVKLNLKSDVPKCIPLREPCLFNIIEDPTESINLASKYRSVVQKLLNRIRKINETAVPPNNKALNCYGHPKYFDGVWINFGDKSGQNLNKKINEANKNNNKNKNKNNNNNKNKNKNENKNENKNKNKNKAKAMKKSVRFFQKMFNNLTRSYYRRKNNQLQEPYYQIKLCTKNMIKLKDIRSDYFVNGLGKDFMDLPILESDIKNQNLLSYESDLYKNINKYKIMKNKISHMKKRIKTYKN